MRSGLLLKSESNSFESFLVDHDSERTRVGPVNFARAKQRLGFLAGPETAFLLATSHGQVMGRDVRNCASLPSQTRTWTRNQNLDLDSELGLGTWTRNL